MDNKELPQEVVNEIDREAREFIKEGYEDAQCGKVFEKQIINSNVKNYTIGAQIAQSHYLKELQAKDTTIKEQAEKIEKLTGLLKEEHDKNTTWIEKPPFTKTDHWQSYKEQHGI